MHAPSRSAAIAARPTRLNALPAARLAMGLALAGGLLGTMPPAKAADGKLGKGADHTEIFRYAEMLAEEEP